MLLLTCNACAASALDGALHRGDVPAAVAAYRNERSRDVDELQRIAEQVLVVEARQLDPARSERAWAVLAGMGPSAEGAWQALEREPGDHAPRRVRALALAWRSRLGDAQARRELRALEEDAREQLGAGSDPEVLALAIEQLDPEHDVQALRRWARAPFAVLRGAAVARLAHASASTETRALLADMVRSEPDQAVRRAAIRALAAQGASAWASLEALLELQPQPSDELRAATLDALYELDALRAAPRVAAVLSDAPSPLGVAAAQDVLARAQRGLRADSLEATAEQQILSALAAPKPELRSRAASAALAVSAGPDRQGLREQLAVRLAAELDRRVYILLALALRDDPGALPALRRLAQGDDVPAAQAAAELAARRDPNALARLAELMTSKSPSVRGTASAALARAYDFALERPQPRSSLDALSDPDPRVRTTTAAALLQAIQHLYAQR